MQISEKYLNLIKSSVYKNDRICLVGEHYVVLLLLGGVGYGLYWIFTMNSPKFKSENINLKDIGNNH